MPKVTEAYLDQRRQQIMNAAYRCFARKGFHQTTMRDIYAEAGLSAGAVYHYFSSKEEIIKASFIFDYHRGLPVLQQAAENPDPLDAIARLLDFFYAGLESAADLGADRVNIQGWAEALVNPQLLAPLHESLQAFLGELSKTVRRGQTMGVIDPALDPEAVGEVILSSYFGLYLQKAFRPDLDVGKYKTAVLSLFNGNFRVAT
ncbi:MAG: TetR/AcrR family transcriptional regulator [Anaerolineae bacterium]|nr:TetR/AcrR family transcriptional regulator [Anaerolineae bacterium]